MNIEIYLKNKEDFRNQFNNNELKVELGDYILNKAHIYKLTRKTDLKLHIETNFEVDEIEKNHMIDMIRSYYGNLIKIELIYLRNSYVKSIVLFFIGIVLLIMSYYSKYITEFLLPEIFIIIGWLAIWETAYNILFSNSKHHLRVKLLKKLTNCYIEIEQKNINI